MNVEIHEKCYAPMEIHVTHDLSDRDILKIRKDAEPFDYMSAKPQHAVVNRPNIQTLQ